MKNFVILNILSLLVVSSLSATNMLCSVSQVGINVSNKVAIIVTDNPILNASSLKVSDNYYKDVARSKGNSLGFDILDLFESSEQMVFEGDGSNRVIKFAQVEYKLSNRNNDKGNMEYSGIVNSDNVIIEESDGFGSAKEIVFRNNVKEGDFKKSKIIKREIKFNCTLDHLSKSSKTTTEPLAYKVLFYKVD